MAKLTINVGATANDRQGDSLRGAFQKINANFSELYTALGLNSDTTLNLGAFQFTGSVMDTTDSSAITIDQAVTVSSNLTVGGDILPSTANGGDLGSLTNPWRSLYVSNNTIFLGGIALGIDQSGELTVDGISVKNLTQVSGNIIPDTDEAYDLGSPTHKFRDLYLSGSTITLGSTTLSTTASGGLSVSGGVFSSGTPTTIAYTGFADYTNVTPVIYDGTITFAGNITPTSFGEPVSDYDFYSSGYYIEDSVTSNMKYDRANYKIYVDGGSPTASNSTGVIISGITNASNELVGLTITDRGSGSDLSTDNLTIYPLDPASENIDTSKALVTSDAGQLNITASSSLTSFDNWVQRNFFSMQEGIITDGAWSDETTVINSTIIYSGLNITAFNSAYGSLYNVRWKWEIWTSDGTLIASPSYGTITSTDLTAYTTLPNTQLRLYSEFYYQNSTITDSVTFTFGNQSLTVNASHNYWTDTHSQSVTTAIVTAGSFSADYLTTGLINITKYGNGDPTIISHDPTVASPMTVGDMEWIIYLRELTSEVLPLSGYKKEIDLSIPTSLYRGVSVPSTSIGNAGDLAGDYAFDASYMYYCTANYDGTTNVWKRVGWSGDTW